MMAVSVSNRQSIVESFCRQSAAQSSVTARAPKRALAAADADKTYI